MTTELFTATGANTWTVPAGVTSVDVEVWASGAGGSSNNFSSRRAGGGGGAYSKKTLSVTAATVYNYLVPAGGAGETGVANAVAGADGWFGGTNFATALVSAKGGGICPSANTAGPGGLSSGGVGDTKFSGGNSGAGNSSGSGAGGGGSAGPDGAGGTGSNAASGNVTGGVGGVGDGGVGGGGGVGGIGPGTNNGGTGTSNVSGGGGGGGGSGGTGTTDSGDGGIAGAPSAGGGSGGTNANNGSLGGAGARGQIRLTYTIASGNTVGTAAGTSTVTGISKALKASVGSSAGTSTAQATSKAIKAVTASASGTSIVNGVARTDARTAGSATGTSTATGIGKTTSKGAGSVAGISTATGVMRALARIVGNSTGSSTVTGTSKAIKTATASASGTSTVNGIARADARMNGSAAGTSTVAGVGKASKKVVGSSSGTSTATGVGKATVRTVGNSVGNSTAAGVMRANARTVGSTGGGYAWKNTITFDHTKVGTVNNTDQSNFPALIFGTYPYLATIANGGGINNTVTLNGQTVPADLIFTSDSVGTNLLSWEIASYNATTGQIEIWVKIPTLSHTTDTVIYIWYGNAAITTYQCTATATWDSNYTLVYHFGNGSTLSNANSTSSSITNTSTGVTATTGQIGGGGTFNGAAYFNNFSSIISAIGSSKTVSAWVKPSSTVVSEQSIITTRGSGGFVLVAQGTQGLNYYHTGGSSAVKTGVITSGAWNYCAATLDVSSSTGRLYAGGTLQTTTMSFSAEVVNGGFTGAIGYQQNTTTRLFIGDMDEVRISNIARSTDWIKTEYNNQFSPSTFYVIGTATQNFVGPFATVLGVGKALARAVASSVGTSVVSGIGKASARAVASSVGTSVVSGIGKASARAVASSVGTSVVSGMVKGLARLTGSAAGTSTVTGVGKATVRTVGNSVGNSTAAGVMRANARTVGNSVGSSTVNGVGSFHNLLPEQLDIHTELTLLSERIELTLLSERIEVTIAQNITTELRIV